ncbi:PH domain-containing protein [Streptomyces sp. NPDC020965]|uniref:PH domain-containing protein n=1 Tax=Streptomyces sp. NPDC020965 TaxID=3365105 RepID=UPI0037ABF8DD
MSHGTLPRAYRLGSSRIGILMTVLTLFSLAVLGPVLSDGITPAWLKVLLPVFFAGLIGRAWFTAHRVGTFADARGIEVRGFFRRTRFGWAEIQDIRAQPNPAAARQPLAPAAIAYVYGRNGKRAQLMCLDSARVNVAQEVAALRAAWEQGRGTA